LEYLCTAVSAVGGIKCELAQAKPDGEVKPLNGPLSFKRDQDAIENNSEELSESSR